MSASPVPLTALWSKKNIPAQEAIDQGRFADTGGPEQAIGLSGAECLLKLVKPDTADVAEGEHSRMRQKLTSQLSVPIHSGDQSSS